MWCQVIGDHADTLLDTTLKHAHINMLSGIVRATHIPGYDRPQRCKVYRKAYPRFRRTYLCRIPGLAVLPRPSPAWLMAWISWVGEVGMVRMRDVLENGPLQD